MPSLRSIAGLTASVLLNVACQGAPDSEELSSALVGAAPESIYDDTGRRYRQFTPPGRREEAPGARDTQAAAPDVEEAVEALRPLKAVRQHRDVSFLGDRDPELARHLRQKPNPGGTKRAGNPLTLDMEVSEPVVERPAPSPPPSTAAASAAGPSIRMDPINPANANSSCQGVYGTDTRTPMFGSSRRRSAPYAQQIMIQFNNATCSGTMIGANTMLTAAHCLWDQATNNWRWPVAFVPGANDGDVDPRPFGTLTCWSSMAVPGGYPGSGSSDFLDFGVVTFEHCGADNPAARVGWMGWWTNGPNDPVVEMFGYPGTFALQTAFPQVAGTSGNAWTHFVGGTGFYYMSTNLDGSTGQSGAPWYLRASDGIWVVGEYSEIVCGGFSPRNQARKIATDMDGFIVSVSPDW